MDVVRTHKHTIGYVTVLLVGFAILLYDTLKLESTQNDLVRTTCALRMNVEVQIAATEAALAADTDGDIYGIPRAAIEAGLTNSKALQAALRYAPC